MTALSVSHQHQEINTDLPFGSLPPRKRAKTEEEKEQRRVERILRNRRAAHASREKKRRHVEYLENYVTDLESALATHESNKSKMSKVQSTLLSLLSDNGIDFSSVDLTLDPCPRIERPDGLELTGSSPVKKQKVSKMFSKKGKSEIPSPSFDDDLSSEDELENDNAQPELCTQSKESDKNPIRSQYRKRKAEDAYISPPGSTSPSKLKLEDDGIANQEYSNLFDDTEDIFSGDKSSSLELYKQEDLNMTPFIKQEQEEEGDMDPFMKQEDEEIKFPDSTSFNSVDCHLIEVEDFCSFNSVHHPAAVIV
uniref:Transcription factor Hac1 n=1 Tax=Ogataea thermomethanolica (nom. inval.) TaxID=310468 RepID=A0A2Z5WAB7_9ASCO|nr:transcription factor Hac1 [Ogataea thermomethanolica (nom. inval.)]